MEIKARSIEYLGNAMEMHGESGVCTCCFGRTTKAAILDRLDATTDPADKAAIDAAILTVARRGGEFSANDVRGLLPAHLTAGGVMGGRFGALSRRGVITHVGYMPSTKANTHGHDVKVWRLAGAA